MAHDKNSQRRNLILNMINHFGQISRTRLIELTDYRPASVGEIVRELLEEKLIIEASYRSVGVGRRRIMLELNKPRLCAMAVSFSANAVTYLISQIDGTVIHKSVQEITPNQDKGLLIDTMERQVIQLLSTCSDRKIIGIGVSIPLQDPSGYQCGRTLLASYTHFNDWVCIDLKKRLEESTGLSVETYSGVIMPVMAEYHFGVAKGVQNFICIELANGIGASIFCNGMAVAGAGGFAGELGHTAIRFNHDPQPLCYCGRSGCVEACAGYAALSKKIQAALDQGVFSTLCNQYEPGTLIPAAAVRRALEEGDRMCLHYVREAALELGAAIANAVNLLNPELIVLHGFMLELGSFFLTSLENAIRENVLSILGHFEIRTSLSMDILRPLGAAAEVFSSYLKSGDYRWVYRLRPGPDDVSGA